MNPFDYLLHELELDHSTADYAMVLRYLLPLWGDLWDENPAAYANGYDVIVSEIASLPDHSLKERMLRFVTDLAHRQGTAGFGPTY